MKQSSKRRGTFFSLLLVLLSVTSSMFALTACQSQQTTGIQTDCPAAQQARALDITPLTGGTHATIVYDDIAESGTSTMKSYNVVTGQTSIIYARPAGELMGNERLSGDGQWVVFDTWKTGDAYYMAKGNQKLQAIRVDGQDVQTLYCTDTTHGLDTIQWSPDQKHIAFTTLTFGPSFNRPGKFYLLNTSHGDLQTEITPSEINNSYPLTWLDATHLYVATKPGMNPARLYLRDITQGANHMQTVWDNPNNSTWGASLSSNGERLYISETSETGDQQTIYMLSATGAGAQTIYHDQVRYESIQICAATNNTLLVNRNISGNTLSSGLYKMSTDGTGLTKVFSQLTSNDLINVGFTTSNENVSRDGSRYAFNDSNSRNNVEYYGNLNGSQPTMFASHYASDSVHIIGWTML
jgi:eukaryotic-like serine/threonine-protein kinase